MAKTTVNAHLVTEPGAEIQETVLLHIDNIAGVAGGVAVEAVKTADAAQSVTVPTKEEFDKVVALANETKKQLNALLAALKA